MSGSRSKEQRQAERRRLPWMVNAEAVTRSADAALQVDLSDFAFRNRASQVVVGLYRAAFAQSKVIATLAGAGLLPAAAPNRRLFLEIALRLHWLEGLPRDERRRAVDTMLAKDRNDTNAMLEYMRKAGHEADFDPTEMDNFELDAVEKGILHQQATRLKAAVDASEVNPWSIYSMWLGETPFAHASASLAGKYAPTDDNLHMLSGEPDPMDFDLEAHRLVQLFVVTTAARIFHDEGMPDEFAERITSAFVI